ncbi:MAG: glycosyltransferase [Gammaproteobacteria bacterium]
MLFVSPRFLFPASTGGQIRTSQILRGLKGGNFEITLISPSPPHAETRFKKELSGVADRLVVWQESHRGLWFRIARLKHLFSRLPIPVATDRSTEGRKTVAQQLAKRPDLVVFDFPHAAVFAPHVIAIPSVMFTHNVEAEIFSRHVQVARNPLMRILWRSQYRKMMAFEKATLSKFDTVVAVSQRDREAMRSSFGITNVAVIRTGVDADFFDYLPPPGTNRVVFIGSMDWLANIDGIQFMLDEIWSLVVQEVPDASMLVVGRNPSAALQAKAKAAGVRWEFTGFVDDVRPFVRQAAVSVIPLRVGGGTRIKVFEAMAMGCPVVSTQIGVEGLPLEDNKHYLRADSPAEFAAAVVKLLNDRELSRRISTDARKYVEGNFSFAEAAREFENICLRTMDKDVSRSEKQC